MSKDPPIVVWIMEKLSDEQFYSELVKELPRKAANFYSYPKGYILQKLHAKLLKGTREHGDTERTDEQVKKELENEYLDLIGWHMVQEYWNDKRRQTES